MEMSKDSAKASRKFVKELRTQMDYVRRCAFPVGPWQHVLDLLEMLVVNVELVNKPTKKKR
jgi:hypothetical protein